MLNIIVCIKVVTDPEAPASTFKIDPAGKRVLPGQGVPPVLNPYDENALEAALKIKDGQPARITVLSAGKTIPKAVIKKSLAVGADDLIVIEDEALEDIDSSGAAAILAAAVKKAGAFELVLTGRMAADTNAGQVGTGLAELLGLPVITDARKIEVGDGRVIAERVKGDGFDVIETPLPCLVTVSHELGELRQANIKGLMAAQKQPFTAWKVADLAIDTAAGRRSYTQRLFIPERKVDCEFLPGETPEEAGANLAVRLKETGKI
ncbi:MAG: electron transfer flavoprotein subunit beta/FixA family protein [Dehalococcoidales bacterium]|jgi:electron transfer flavoprotein beta subunit